MVPQIERQQPPGFSIGRSGLARRDSERLFATFGERPGTASDIPQAQEWLQRATDFMSSHHERVSRIAGRAIVDGTFLEGLNPNSALAASIEGIIPVSNTQEKLFMVMFGVNHLSRQDQDVTRRPPVDLDSNTLAKAWQDLGETPPLQRIESIRRDPNYVVVDTMPSEEGQRMQISNLLRDTFGRTEKEIESLSQKLAEAKDNPQTRSAWFSAIFNRDGDIVAVAMAEALEIAGVLVVESTEWVTHKNYLRNGYGPAVVSDVTNQVVHDLRRSQMPWVIYAETNVDKLVKAYALAIRAGYGLVDTLPAGVPFATPQMLNSSTRVNGIMSNFRLVSLPEENSRQYYN
ncbi:hypothetical protein C4579_04100 [Candidatus Microgenomates bacterium]|nr:MAG: hypothetical protein C4579_04100 [Candidatus Microgenomates bacterium]